MLSNNFMKIVPITIVAFIIGCGGTKTNLIPAPDGSLKAPEWYTSVPEKNGYFFAVSSMTSQDMQISIRKAEADARADLARQMGSLTENIVKQFQEEVGLGDDSELLQQFSSATKIRTQQTINSGRIIEQDIVNHSGVYRAYVLMSLSQEEAIEGIRDVIKANENMRTRFEATEAYKELEEEMEVFKNK